MTGEQLREKVTREIIDTRFGDLIDPQRPDYRIVADAAIRVVLEAAIDHLDNKEWPANLSAPDHLRSLLPQDKQEDAA